MPNSPGCVPGEDQSTDRLHHCRQPPAPPPQEAEISLGGGGEDVGRLGGDEGGIEEGRRRDETEGGRLTASECRVAEVEGRQHFSNF